MYLKLQKWYLNNILQLMNNTKYFKFDLYNFCDSKKANYNLGITLSLCLLIYLMCVSARQCFCLHHLFLRTLFCTKRIYVHNMYRGSYFKNLFKLTLENYNQFHWNRFINNCLPLKALFSPWLNFKYRFLSQRQQSSFTDWICYIYHTTAAIWSFVCSVTFNLGSCRNEWVRKAIILKSVLLMNFIT